MPKLSTVSFVIIPVPVPVSGSGPVAVSVTPVPVSSACSSTRYCPCSQKYSLAPFSVNIRSSSFFTPASRS